MDYFDALTHLFQEGLDSMWNGVNATPVEKLDWRPAPDARTAREILAELPYTTTYSAEMVRSRKQPDVKGEESGTPKGKQEISELEKAHRASVEEFLEAIQQFPEEHLQDSLDLPWGTRTFLQIITYPYWNMMYHWGQISYIQTMYGDKETH